jgi:peptidyl-prolyl cis-trans isomerase C
MLKRTICAGLTLVSACQFASAAEIKPGATCSSNGVCAVPQEDALSFLPEVVATYNDKKVMATEIRKMVAPRLKMMEARGQQLPKQMLVRMAHEIVQGIVDQELLLKKASEAGVKADSNEAQEQLDQIEQKMGKENFDAALQAQGFTRQEITERMSQEMTIRKWIDMTIASKQTVDAEEVKAYYQENKQQFSTPEQLQASHILFTLKPDATAEEKATARKKAEGVLASLKKGADFAKLAQKESACPSGKRGGDLGSFSRGQMVPAFEEAAFALKEGALSDIVETRFGLHIIKAGKHTPASDMTFDEVQEKIKEQLTGKKINDAVGETLERLRKAAKVTILVPEK